MSVRRRKWVTRKGEAKEAWIVDYSVSGSRHIETFERKKEADARAAQVKVDVGKGIHVAPNKTPLVKDAGDRWIEACKAQGLEPATIAAYEQHVRLHIVPYLGMLRLAQLTIPIIRQFQDDMLAGKLPLEQAAKEGKTHSAKAKRSPAMVKRVVISFGTMLADSQERGLVATNVVRGLKSNRKRGKERQAERRKRGKLKVGVDIPSREEIKTIMAHVPDRWRPVVLTAAFTGLRASELRGLKWNDVDLRHGKLHVRQRADRYGAIGEPKSESGERTLPLPPMVASALREWKLKCPKGDLGLVFPSGAGEIEHHANILHRGFEPAQIAAGVTVVVEDEKGKPVLDDDGKPRREAKYALHALRHFYASWCINRKVDGGLELPIKVVQERLGHSTINLTADVYGHLFPSADDGTELKEAEKFFLA
jgi:integrase